MTTPVYPSFGFDPGRSRQQPVDDLVVDQWPNGSSRGRSYFTPGKMEWTLYHDLLSDANRATLKAFYDANKLLPAFDFVSPWDGVTYHNVGFIPPPPEYIPLKSSSLFWDVKVFLRQYS